LFVFGEAERGAYHAPVRLHSLPQLLDQFGHPPKESLGIEYAIQSLLSNREVLFYRVKEEGFSREDYLQGFSLLRNEGGQLNPSAICMPGVGDVELIDTLSPIFQKLKALLLISEKDFYDYLTG
jgi:hypothetical protein